MRRPKCILHIITVCSRPDMLSEWAADLVNAAKRIDIELRWHVGFDLHRKIPGGHSIKNALIDSIKDGWVWIGDDDNQLDPDMLSAIVQYDTDKLFDAVVFAQWRGKVVQPVIELGKIDAAQFVARRGFIGDLSLPLEYNGDGHWIVECRKRGIIAHDSRPLTIYNARRPESWTLKSN